MNTWGLETLAHVLPFLLVPQNLPPTPNKTSRGLFFSLGLLVQALWLCCEIKSWCGIPSVQLEHGRHQKMLIEGAWGPAISGGMKPARLLTLATITTRMSHCLLQTDYILLAKCVSLSV